MPRKTTRKWTTKRKTGKRTIVQFNKKIKAVKRKLTIALSKKNRELKRKLAQAKKIAYKQGFQTAKLTVKKHLEARKRFLEAQAAKFDKKLGGGTTSRKSSKRRTGSSKRKTFGRGKGIGRTSRRFGHKSTRRRGISRKRGRTTSRRRRSA